MPWLRTCRPGARAAERSGALAPWRQGCTLACTGPEGARAMARPGGAGTGASTDRHGHARPRPVPPSCVTTATASLWVRHRRTAQPPACLIPSRFSYALGIATKSPLCIHTSLHFPPDPVACLPASPASPPRAYSWATARPGRACPAAVRRRSPTDRYRSSWAADDLRGGPDGPLRSRSGSQGSFRFLRVLPGLSPTVPAGM